MVNGWEVVRTCAFRKPSSENVDTSHLGETLEPTYDPIKRSYFLDLQT